MYEWEGCNPLPPEFWLFPSFLPFHPGKKLSFIFFDLVVELNYIYEDDLNLFVCLFVFHFNYVAKMWGYCRTTYIPMSYLYGKRYHGPITDLVLALRQEIYPVAYTEINWSKQRHNCCKDDLYYPHSYIQDVLWDGLHYLGEPIINRWPFNKLRKRALQRTMELMHYGSEVSRYINMACVDKVSSSFL